MPFDESAEARALVDFLNHGSLPFVGHLSEIENLLGFWEGTYEAQGLRAALLVGEAGIGKSRVVEEVIGAIAADGGVVIHAKLYPESATSVPRLLASAIGASAAAGQFGVSIADERLPSVIGALQRIARLRPTLLIIEDIHLLNDDSLGDFATLLQALSDEALSILAVARTVDFVPRGLLERYLVAEIKVRGLDEGHIRELWRQLFGGPADDSTIAMLLGATNGNPLAVRSALRGAITAGALDHAPLGGWRVMVDEAAFATILERGAEVLAEGMAAHLDAEERRGAESLACLGEIFSRESARVMLDDAERIVELLTFKGILTIATTAPAPLAGRVDGEFPASNYPLLAFTHSLVHRRFIQQAGIDIARVARVIASDAPLYSHLPFRLLAGDRSHPTVPPHEARNLVRRVVALAFDLDESPDWEIAIPVLEGAMAMAERLDRAAVPEEHLRDIDVRLTSCRLSLMRRSQHTDEFRALVEAFVRDTSDPATLARARHRLMALSHIYRFSARWDRERLAAIWNEVGSLLERFPDLIACRPYVTFLRDVALDARREGDIPRSQLVEERLTALLESPSADENLRHVARRVVAPFLLVMFSTREELERRKELLAQLERMPDEVNSLSLTKMQFLMTIGEMERAIQVCEVGVPRMFERGLDRSWVHGALVKVYAEAALGLDLSEARAQIEKIESQASEPALPRFRESAGLMFSEIAMLRGDFAAMEEILERFPQALNHVSAETLVVRGLERNDPDVIGHVRRTSGIALREFNHLLFTFGTEDTGALALAFIEAFGIELLRTSDITALYAALDLLGAHERDPNNAPLPETVAAAAAAAVSGVLQWFADRKLPLLLDFALERYAWRLAPKEAAEWRRRSEALARSGPPSSVRTPARMRISMLGVVEITTPEGEKIRPRGARVRALLALMVADRMLERPLEHREFCRLAADNQDDPEHARKVVNVSVFRLRELLGQDVILTDAETPRLNLEKVEADLLQADALLDEVDESMARGLLMRAYNALEKVFEITRGEVPFPSLFDGFFEAARKDFECRLRDATVDVARGLLYEGDRANADAILARARAVMPEDLNSEC